GRPIRSVRTSRSGTSLSGTLTLDFTRPVANSMTEGTPTPTAVASASRSSSTEATIWSISASAPACSVGMSRCSLSAPSRKHAADEPLALVERRLMREQRGDVRVRTQPEQDDIEVRQALARRQPVAQLLFVGLRARVRAQLALHAVHARVPAREEVEQRRFRH